MALKTHISVNVSVENIRDSLRKKIVSEHSKLITDVIMGNLNGTDVGLEQLFQALSGIETSPKFKVGDHVMVKTSDLGTWKFDVGKNKTAGIIIQDRIRGQIISINLYAKYNIGVKFSAIQSDDTSKELESYVLEHAVCKLEEWPGEDTEDDLPF